MLPSLFSGPAGIQVYSCFPSNKSFGEKIVAISTHQSQYQILYPFLWSCIEEAHYSLWEDDRLQASSVKSKKTISSKC